MNETDMPVVPEAASEASPGNFSRSKVNAEQHDLAVAWIAAEILGAAAISLTPDSVGLWRMLAPLGFMAGYLVFALTRSQYNTPRVADSVYFMGFWWTLWALINVLLFHGEKNPLTAARLYETFGYALVTTAAGMFVRLAMLQFYRTLEDQEEQAVDEIDERVSKLVGELELSQKAAATLRASGVLALQEWHKQFVVASEETVAGVKQMAGKLTTEGEALTTSVKTIQHSMTSMGRLFATLEKRLGTSSDQTASAIEKSVQSLESSVEVLVKRLEGVEVPPDLVRSKLDQVLDSVRKAVGPVADLSVNTLAQLKTAVEDVGKALVEFPQKEQLQSAVVNLSDKLNLVAGACVHLTQEAEVTRKALSAIGSGAAAVLTQLTGVEQRVTDVQTGLESVSSAVQAVGNDAQKVNATVREVVRFVQSSLGEPR